MALTLVELVITGAAAAAETVSVRVAAPVPEPLVAVIETLKVPAAVGVPEITPVDVLTLRPAGKPVAAKFVGEFVAVI